MEACYINKYNFILKMWNLFLIMQIFFDLSLVSYHNKFINDYIWFYYLDYEILNLWLHQIESKVKLLLFSGFTVVSFN